MKVRGSIRRRHVIIVTISVLAVGLFVVLYLGAIAAYHKETTSRAALLEQKAPDTPDYVDIEMKIISVDLVQENMTLRMDFVPQGAFSDSDSELSRDLRLLVTSSTGGTERLLAKDQYISPTDVTVELVGTVSDYPWDKHENFFAFAITTPKIGGVSQPVPTKLTCFGSLAGLNLDAKMATASSTEQSVLAFEVQRSTVIKVVVPFSMGLLWVLTAAVLSMVIAVLVGNKIEMVMFPFIGTILFSMVAFRNALPGAPPIGAISDYLAFFWGYALCVLALLALTITWLRRLPKKPKPFGARTDRDDEAGKAHPAPVAEESPEGPSAREP